MKKLLWIVGLGFVMFTSCKKEQQTTFVKEELGSGYYINIPEYYSKYGENIGKTAWKSNDGTLLIEGEKKITSDLFKENETFSSQIYSNDLYKSTKRVDAESFENSGTEGVIFYFENAIKGKGLNLIGFTTYDVYATVQKDGYVFQFKSSNINKNNFKDISSTIRSIWSNTSTKLADLNLEDDLRRSYEIREQKILDSVKRINDEYLKTINSLKDLQSQKATDSYSKDEDGSINSEEEEVLAFLKEHYNFYLRDKVYRNPIIKKIDDYNYIISLEESNRRFEDSDFHYRAKVVDISEQEDGSLKMGKRYYKIQDGRTRYGDTYYGNKN